MSKFICASLEAFPPLCLEAFPAAGALFCPYHGRSENWVLFLRFILLLWEKCRRHSSSS